MGLKGKIEAIIYAAEEPITLDQVALLMKEPVLQEIAAEQERSAAEAQEHAAQDPAEQATAAEESAAAPVEEDWAESAGSETVAEVTSGQAEEQPATEEPADVDSEERVDDTQSGAQEEAQQNTESSIEPSAESTPVSEDTAPGAPGIGPEIQAPNEAPATSEEPAAEASEKAQPTVSAKRRKNQAPPEVKERVWSLIQELISDYANNDRGMEIRHIAGGYRMATKPEHHDIVKAFAKSLKPPLRLSLPALETLAVVAYKQPVTAPEVGEIRGVESQGVMATLLERKLITTAGRKAVIGRPILYKTTKEFLLRFGLNSISELPSMEEFEKLAQEQSGLFIGGGEPEPSLTPEEAAARLEKASAAEEEASGPATETDTTATSEATEMVPNTEEVSSTEQQAEPVAPEETHQN